MTTVQIKAITPQGTFLSIPRPLDSGEVDQFDDFVRKFTELSYLSFQSAEGEVYLPKGTIQNSVFLIVKS